MQPAGARTAVASPSDMISTPDIALLLGIEKRTLHNKLSKNRPGIPVLKGRGRTPNAYSYREIRPWLILHWSTKQAVLSQSFDDVTRILRDKRASKSHPAKVSKS